MKKHLLTILCISIGLGAAAQPDWNQIKSAQAPTNMMPAEFGTPYPLNMSNLGWEDGQHISRDGLTAYCFYMPIDLLAMNFLAPVGGPDPCIVSPYMRGPAVGVTFDSVPSVLQGTCTEFLNSNILISHRNSTTDTFPAWTSSNINFPATFDGAPCVVLNDTDPTMVDFFVYAQLNPDPLATPNNTGEIWMVTNTTLDPGNAGSPLPSPVNTDSTSEDNPHIERLANGDLVLYFTSEDRPGGLGEVDIYVSTSTDNGSSWSTPVGVNFNTNQFEDMPHIWQDTAGIWWMFHMDVNQSIVRRQQQTPGDWVNWGAPTTILTPGPGEAVGEPTLTQWGDLVFGFVFDAGSGWGTDSTDRFDDDFWVLPRIGSPMSIQTQKKPMADIKLYPNPSNGQFALESQFPNYENGWLEVLDLSGKRVYQNLVRNGTSQHNLNLSPGVYAYRVTSSSTLTTGKLIIR